MIAKRYEMRVGENRLPYLAAVGDTKITDMEKHENPQKMVDIIRYTYHVERLPEEHVYLMAFDTKLHLIGLFELSHGTSRESVVGPAQIMQRLFLCGASAFCIAHNHPSGDITPSVDDAGYMFLPVYRAAFLSILWVHGHICLVSLLHDLHLLPVPQTAARIPAPVSAVLRVFPLRSLPSPSR